MVFSNPCTIDFAVSITSLEMPDALIDGMAFVSSCLSVEASPDDHSDLPELDESGLFSLGLSL